MRHETAGQLLASLAVERSSAGRSCPIVAREGAPGAGHDWDCVCRSVRDLWLTVTIKTFLALHPQDIAFLDCKLTHSLVIVLASLVSLGCSDGRLHGETKAAPEIERAVAATETTRYCYRNEYPFEDAPNQKDVQSLTIEISAVRASGEYNWLPAFKDQRVGRFEGTVDGQSIVARYEYTQEGQSGVTTISIRLEPGQAVVEGGSAALGLAATLTRVDC